MISLVSFTRTDFITGSNPQKVIVADIDVDGRLDISTANGNNSVSVLRNKSTPNFIQFENHVDFNSTTPGGAETIAIADLDIDGRPDIAEYNFSNNVYTISILRNLSQPGIIGAGTFALPISFGSGLVSDSDIAIGDLDNDGRPDLLANFGSTNSLSILKSLTVPGNFNLSSFATKVDFGTGTGPLCGKQICDLNGDGFPDVISTNRESNTVSVFQNRAQVGIINTSSFLPKVDFSTGQKPSGVVAADLDGDGMADLAVVSRDSRLLQIYRNQIADPIMSSFTPTSGVPGSEFTISGGNFTDSPTNIIVHINGTKAEISTATRTSITAVVPEGATTGEVTVTKNGAAIAAPSEFLVLPLSITSFQPPVAFAGEHLVIHGSGFSLGWTTNIIKVNGIDAKVESCTANELRVTVPPSATTGKVTVTVNGLTATSDNDLIITPAVISGVTFPEFHIEEGAPVAASINIGNVSEVVGLKFLSRGISSSSPTFKEDNIESFSSGQVAFPIPSGYFSDPIGLQMKFIITDKSGYQIEREGYAYKRYPAGNESQVIPSLQFGGGVEDYQIISIPLNLTDKVAANVFHDAGDFDNTKWRIYSFENQKSEELTTADATISAGYGYWFISKNELIINPGEGTTVYVNEEQPFIIRLRPGWNLIGNPYNFTLNWQDVLAYNNNPEPVGDLRHFKDGTFAATTTIDRFRGAFVRNSSTLPYYLKIPVINKSSGSSRTRKVTEDISSNNWEIDLTVTDGLITSKLGGFGMRMSASDEIDRWDEFALPVPQSLSSFELSMNERFPQLIKDIVHTNDSHIWSVSMNTALDVDISWRIFGQLPSINCCTWKFPVCLLSLT